MGVDSSGRSKTSPFGLKTKMRPWNMSSLSSSRRSRKSSSLRPFWILTSSSIQMTCFDLAPPSL